MVHDSRFYTCGNGQCGVFYPPPRLHVLGVFLCTSVSPADCFRGGSHFKPTAGFEVLALRRSHCLVGFLSADDAQSAQRVITYQAGECCFSLMSPLFAGGCWGQMGQKAAGSCGVRAMAAIIGLNPASHDPYSPRVHMECGSFKLDSGWNTSGGLHDMTAKYQIFHYWLPCSYMSGLEDTPKASLLTVDMGYDVVGPLRSSGGTVTLTITRSCICILGLARDQLIQAKCTVRATCICCR